jgi:uncharacterized membrane protein
LEHIKNNEMEGRDARRCDWRAWPARGMPLSQATEGEKALAEIETLTVDEPLDERIERHNFDRLLMLSDGVFAIAITLLALELRPPEHWQGGISELVTAMWRPLFAYTAGFLIIGGFWIVHRRLFAKLRRVDAVATALALLLLFLIAGIPAVAMLIAEHGPTRSMLLYIIMVAAISIAQFGLWSYAALVADLADPSLDRKARLHQALLMGLPAVAFTALSAAGLAGVDVTKPLPMILTLLPLAALRRWLGRRVAVTVTS